MNLSIGIVTKYMISWLLLVKVLKEPTKYFEKKTSLRTINLFAEYHDIQ